MLGIEYFNCQLAFVKILAAALNASGTPRVLSVVASSETSNSWSCECLQREILRMNIPRDGYFYIAREDAQQQVFGLAGVIKLKIIDMGFLFRKWKFCRSLFQVGMSKEDREGMCYHFKG